jgi:hypothetical protein
MTYWCDDRDFAIEQRRLDAAQAEAVQTLRVKLATVIRERKAGRGDYDRLTAIIDDLRASLRTMGVEPP